MQFARKFSLIIIVFALAFGVAFFGLKNGADYAQASSYDYVGGTYTISSQEAFEAFVKDKNGSSSTFVGETIILKSDVSFNGAVFSINNFAGTFNGNGHRVYGLKKTLFRNVMSGGKVLNTDFVGAELSNSKGAICETNNGNIINVGVFGTNAFTYAVNAAGLAVDNAGVIDNCVVNISYETVYPVTIGGLVINNTKIVSNCLVLHNANLPNTVKTFGGMVVTNTGDISESMAGGVVNVTAVVGSESVMPSLGLFADANYGALIRCTFIGDVQAYAYGGTTASLDFYNKNSYTSGETTVTGTAKGCYFQLPAVTKVDSPNEGFVAVNSLTELFAVIPEAGFVASGNSMPIPLTLINGQGTAAEPFIIASAKDFYKINLLYNAFNLSSYAILSSDIELKGYPLEFSNGGLSLSVNIDARGFALRDAEGAFLFADATGSSAEGLGLFYGGSLEVFQGVANGNGVFTEKESYSYGADGNVTIITAVSPVTGDGTANNPYVINNREELAAIDGSDKHYVLAQDILVNSVAENGDYKLDIAVFDGVLNGNGYSVIGLINEPLINNLTGGVVNTEIRSYLAGATDVGALANVLGGNATFVTVTANGGKAFVNTLNGVIEKCISYAEGGIANGGIGSVNNTFNMSAGTAIAGGEVAVNTSLQITASGFDAVSGGASVSNPDYFQLLDRKYNFSQVYGYQIGSGVPSLRVPEGIYKKSSDNQYTAYSFNNVAYSPSQEYTKTVIEGAVVTSVTAEAAFQWYKDNGEFSQPTFCNAGEYRYDARFDGDDYYLPSKFSQTLKISKAEVGEAMTFDSGSFAAINTVYSGADQTISQPTPNNMSSYGYVYAYDVKFDGASIPSVRYCGDYIQYVYATSENYTDKVVSRKITVTKAKITVTVGDVATDYLNEAVFGDGLAVTDGLVGEDTGKELNTLALTGGYVCAYKAGDDASEYAIDYQATFANYTISSVVKGKLTVRAIALEKGGMVFESAQKTYNGTYIRLSVESLVEGAHVVYLNNDNTDVGTYSVTAIINKKNYTELRLNAELTIIAKAITVKVNDLARDYGYAPAKGDFSVDGSSFDDDIALLNAVITDYKWTTAGGEIPTEWNAGSYKVTAVVTDKPWAGKINNYSITWQEGVFTVNAVSMKTLYPTQGDVSATFDGNGIYPKIAFYEDKGATVIYRYYDMGNEGAEVTAPIDAGRYKVVAEVNKLNLNYLDTQYVYYLTINKFDVEISFAKAEYSFVYNGTAQVNENNVPYNGVLPQGVIAVFSCKKDGVAVEGKNKGEYEVSYTVAESKNFFEKKITATVIILPKTIAIELKTDYVYSNSPVTLTVTKIDGVIGGELQASDITIKTYSKSNVLMESVSNAGGYVAEAVLPLGNYTLMQSRFDFTVSKLTVEVDLKKIEFPYGTYGRYTYQNITYDIGSQRITRYDYNVAATNEKINLQYNIIANNAATYTVGAILTTANYDFVLSADSLIEDNNKVVILRKELTVMWKYSGVDVGANSYNSTYTGADQTNGYTYVVFGMASGEDASSLDIRRKINGSTSTVIKKVGSYENTLTLFGTTDYYLNAAPFTVNVNKAVLNVAVKDSTVEAGDSFNAISYEVFGRLGEDANTAVSDLAGSSIALDCSYDKLTAYPGQTYRISLSMAFDNYTIEITRYGTLTVVRNLAKVFSMDDKTYVYDGKIKSLAVNEAILPEYNVTVTYSANNSQTDVGNYPVTVTVTYNGTNKTPQVITRNLTIIQASPTVKTDDIVTCYVEGRLLDNSEISAQASADGKAVDGTFEFVGQLQLNLGKNTYYVMFTPSDGKNYKTVTQTVNVEAKRIDATIFSFDNVALASLNADTLSIKGRVVMTLRTDVLSGLKLLYNNSEVAMIAFYKNEDSVNIKVKYGDYVLIDYNWRIALVAQEEPDPVITVSPSDILTVSGALRMETAQIIIGKGGGRLFVKPEYADQFALYVNGARVSEQLFNGDENYANIVIKSYDGKIVYFERRYSVTGGNIVDGSAKGQSFFEKYKTYFIIGIVAVSLALLTTVAIVLIKRYNNKKGSHYNPYNFTKKGR